MTATAPASIGPLRMFGSSSDSWRKRVWRRFVRHRLAVASLILLVVISATVMAAPLLTPHGPIKFVGATEAKPTWDHPLGTDRLGRDVWARLVYGGRVSISVGIVAVAISIAWSRLSMAHGPASRTKGRSLPMVRSPTVI